MQERKVSGDKFINKAIAGKLPSKTNKQISDKRKWLRGKSNAKTTKAQNSTLTHEPEHTAVQEPPTIPLEDILNEAICKIELECVEMSAELPSHAIEGKDIVNLQDKLIDTIKAACSKPIKAKYNGPANPPKNLQDNKKNKQKDSKSVLKETKAASD